VPPARETLLRTTRFSVERVRCTHPDGGQSTHEFIVHPGAVVILPILDEETWIMIRNFRPALGRELLELPAGTLEPGEDPAACAARELEEETGYRAAQWEPLGAFYSCPGISNERMYGFVARVLTATRQRLAPGERIRVEPVRPADVLRRVRMGELEDGKSIALLATYFLRQDR
jgi:ADP-ribose pyrophosphatase